MPLAGPAFSGSARRFKNGSDQNWQPVSRNQAMSGSRTIVAFV
jgi:hypothetical protein